MDSRISPNQYRPIHIGDTPLDTLCERCKGAGQFYNENYEQEYQRWESEGMQGRQPQDHLWCGECGGIGYYPTEAGRAILALVRRYARC